MKASLRFAGWALSLLAPGTGLRNLDGILKFSAQVFELLVTYGAVFTLLAWKLVPFNYFSSRSDMLSWEKLSVYFADKGYQIALAVALVFLLINARTAIRKELLSIAPLLFSPGTTPQHYNTVHGYGVLPFLLAYNVAVILALAYFIDHISIFSAILASYAALNLVGMYFIRKNLFSYFDNPKYAPIGPHRQFFIHRRKATSTYLKHAHNRKEVVLLVGCIGVALSTGYIPEGSRYLLMTFSLILNELIVTRWRRMRDNRLENIEQRQIEADRKRLKEVD